MLDLAKQPTPEWTTLPELSVKLVFSCYVANDNHFYRLGGLQETHQNTLPKFDESVSEFDIEEGEWQKRQSFFFPNGAEYACMLLLSKLFIEIR